MTAHVAIPRITADGVVYETDPAFDRREVVSRINRGVGIRAAESGYRTGGGRRETGCSPTVTTTRRVVDGAAPRGVPNDGPPELAIEVG